MEVSKFQKSVELQHFYIGLRTDHGIVLTHTKIVFIIA